MLGHGVVNFGVGLSVHQHTGLQCLDFVIFAVILDGFFVDLVVFFVARHCSPLAPSFKWACFVVNKFCFF